MGQGQGSITSNKKQDPAGAPSPPFALNSAFNGLSVDIVTGQIVLGQDVGAVGNPAAFVSSREIPMSLFDFAMFLLDGTDPFAALAFRQVGGHSVGNIGSVVPPLGNDGFNMNWDVDNAGAGWVMNQTGFTANTVMQLTMQDDGLGTVADFEAKFDNGGGNQSALLLDWANQLFQMGDVNDFANGNKLSIDDVGQRWEIGQRTAITNLLLNFPAASIGLAFFDSAGNNPFLLPDPGTGGIAFISAPDFSTQLALADAGSGSVADLGDVGAATTGMTLRVDVPNSEVVINDGAAGAAVRINTVLGFTGVVAPVNTITVDGGIVTNVA